MTVLKPYNRCICSFNFGSASTQAYKLPVVKDCGHVVNMLLQSRVTLWRSRISVRDACKYYRFAGRGHFELARELHIGCYRLCVWLFQLIRVLELCSTIDPDLHRRRTSG
jgi:hypothetical protein